MAKMSPLRRHMIEDVTFRNLSRHTRQSYICAAVKFSRHFNPYGQKSMQSGVISVVQNSPTSFP